MTDLQNPSPLIEQITSYYTQRGLVWPPDADTALQWVVTELGEVTEVLLARKARWVRNNPEDKTGFSKDALAYELGDVVMMALVAGIVEGVDPIKALQDKMSRKLQQTGGEQ